MTPEEESIEERLKNAEKTADQINWEEIRGMVLEMFKKDLENEIKKREKAEKQVEKYKKGTNLGEVVKTGVTAGIGLTIACAGVYALELADYVGPYIGLGVCAAFVLYMAFSKKGREFWKG